MQVHRVLVRVSLSVSVLVFELTSLTLQDVLYAYWSSNNCCFSLISQHQMSTWTFFFFFRSLYKFYWVMMRILPVITHQGVSHDLSCIKFNHHRFFCSAFVGAMMSVCKYNRGWGFGSWQWSGWEPSIQFKGIGKICSGG